MIVLSYYGLRIYKRNVLTYQEGNLLKPMWRSITKMLKISTIDSH
ncbi:hypothetical protein [Weissella ceti]|nr:hypothetical protein [Weissella ceti]